MKSKIIETVSNSVAVVFTGLQISMTDLENIISIICLVLTSISVLITLICRVINWIKKAKEDGKIDEEEILNLQQILQSSNTELMNITNKENKK